MIIKDILLHYLLHDIVMFLNVQNFLKQYKNN